MAVSPFPPGQKSLCCLFQGALLDQCQPSQINPVFSSSLRSRVEYLRAPLPATQDNAISSVQPESPCSLITSFLTSKPRCPLRTGVCCPMQGWRRPCTVRAGVFSVALHSSSPRAGLTPVSLHCSPPHTHAPARGPPRRRASAVQEPGRGERKVVGLADPRGDPRGPPAPDLGARAVPQLLD